MVMEIGGVEVVHFVPGRVRFKVDKVKGSPEFAHRVEQELATIEGIDSVEAKSLTGSVIVNYNKERIVRPEELENLSAVLSALFPGIETDKLREWLIKYQ
jgi:hypothetical protein